MQRENIHHIVEQAKQQRAEVIGAAVRKHPIATLLVIAVPVLLVQVPWELLGATV